MKLTIKKSDWLDDWYVIERAEHDGCEWFEVTGPNSSSFNLSSRFSDACVEGTLAEMESIAAAIRGRTHESFRRCAVDATSSPVAFWSPRNSQVNGEVKREEAEDLAGQIEDVVRRTRESANHPTPERK